MAIIVFWKWVVNLRIGFFKGRLRLFNHHSTSHMITTHWSRFMDPILRTNMVSKGPIDSEIRMVQSNLFRFDTVRSLFWLCGGDGPLIITADVPIFDRQQPRCFIIGRRCGTVGCLRGSPGEVQNVPDRLQRRVLR